MRKRKKIYQFVEGKQGRECCSRYTDLLSASLYTRLSLMGDLKKGTGDEGSGVDMPESPLGPMPGSPSWLMMCRWMPEKVLKTYGE